MTQCGIVLNTFPNIVQLYFDAPPKGLGVIPNRVRFVC